MRNVNRRAEAAAEGYSVSAKSILSSLSALPLSNRPGTAGTVGTAAEIEAFQCPDPEFSEPGQSGQKAAPVDPEPKPIRWIDRHDVVTVVEDLSDERRRPRWIAGTLGLTRAEVITVLRRTGR
jgi:hypothetical protein